MSVDLVDPAVRLSATEGRTHLTGLQALARVPIEVRRRDHRELVAARLRSSPATKARRWPGTTSC